MQGWAFAWTGLLALTAFVSTSQAALVEIIVSDVDVAYDGSTITDSDPTVDVPVDDPLTDKITNADFFESQVFLGNDNSDVTIDLAIPGVLNIPAGGGSVTTAAGGTISLQFGGGKFLTLSLTEAEVNYTTLSTPALEFVFTGAVGSIDGQYLPFNLVIADPVEVSFSVNPGNSVAAANGFVTGFTGSGSGEIRAIPEPASVVLLAAGGLLMLRGRHAA